VTERSIYLIAAAACLGAACRSEPKVEQPAVAPPLTALPAAANAIDASAAPAEVADAAATDAPANAEIAALAGMWRGRMTFNAAPSPSPLNDDNGLRGRAVTARIDEDGAVGVAIQQHDLGVGFAPTGASSLCTIDGAIEKRRERLVFVGRASSCQGRYALARHTGLELLNPCQLRWTDLDKPAGAGALFTLKRRGCPSERDR
jgi:hypothetical protein